MEGSLLFWASSETAEAQVEHETLYPHVVMFLDESPLEDHGEIFFLNQMWKHLKF